MVYFLRNRSFGFDMRCKAYAIITIIMNHVPLLEEGDSELPCVVFRVTQAEGVSYFRHLHGVHIWGHLEPVVAEEEVYRWKLIHVVRAVAPNVTPVILFIMEAVHQGVR